MRDEMLKVVVLAAGKGTRMKSDLPKVLHPIAGVPMLQHVWNIAAQLKPAEMLTLIGHHADIIQQQLPQANTQWVLQTEQLGTGHAVMQTLPHLSPDDNVLILSGDVPLITHDTLHSLQNAYQNSDGLALLTAILPNPQGLGRIIREDTDITAIIEEKDASAEQKQINEINSGIYWVKASHLLRWLPQLQNNNAQQEFYLTDIVKIALQEGLKVSSHTTQDMIEIQGVNDRKQLAFLERAYQTQQAEHLMRQGVTLADPTRIDIRGQLTVEPDVFIDINCVFEGNVTLTQGVKIGPNCLIRHSHIGKNTEVFSHSILDGVTTGDNCHIGPFARLRPGTEMDHDVKIGNFVETKNTKFGAETKASHLSYIGDAEVGAEVNIGAGTITCNYDGVNKHKTIIEDGAFIGSDTQLVAPVTVGKNATLGAGTTLRKDAPANALTLTVSSQKTITTWQRPKKNTQ
jgi:bifunctional UDP-N-acetylglucosamine pyrophosphorylase/glucosamine-1-phosphate N-acetyltransferase